MGVVWEGNLLCWNTHELVSGNRHTTHPLEQTVGSNRTATGTPHSHWNRLSDQTEQQQAQYTFWNRLSDQTEQQQAHHTLWNRLSDQTEQQQAHHTLSGTGCQIKQNSNRHTTHSLEQAVRSNRTATGTPHTLWNRLLDQIEQQHTNRHTTHCLEQTVRSNRSGKMYSPTPRKTGKNNNIPSLSMTCILQVKAHS